MTKPLTAWSYSRWDTHHTCPLKFKLSVLDGNRIRESPQMKRGQMIHRDIAMFLIEGGALTTDVKANRSLIKELRNFDNKLVEQQWGFTRQWKATGWFGGDTWLRSVLDALVIYDDMTAVICDWKTGKPRGTHDDQMELFAVSAFCHIPSITEVETRLVYTDFTHQELAEFKAADREKLIAKWERKVAPMFEDTEYLPRPSEHCRFCDFSRSRGGPCRFG